ncbi:hypothetical protein J1779_07915 [Rahnella sp. FC061912-K]|uniref:hypothetical protein n=1 Tax=Rahnella rivi TaxID=2816249 RepID=UPI001C274ED8|nr:hypothetical protein [Rahnella rivi]MBU9829856.1 hypothetical protein [Rahnella rivi]
MDTKAAFEKWWDENQEFLSGKLKVTPATAFIIWKASREAIEIEFPEHCNGTTPEAEGYDDALDECIEAITSNRIRIKGKTE